LVKGILPIGCSGSCSPHPQATVAIARSRFSRSLSRINSTNPIAVRTTKRLEREHACHGFTIASVRTPAGAGRDVAACMLNSFSSILRDHGWRSMSNLFW
jgi:hypothetical protein